MGKVSWETYYKASMILALLSPIPWACVGYSRSQVGLTLNAMVIASLAVMFMAAWTWKRSAGRVEDIALALSLYTIALGAPLLLVVGLSHSLTNLDRLILSCEVLAVALASLTVTLAHTIRTARPGALRAVREGLVLLTPVLIIAAEALVIRLVRVSDPRVSVVYLVSGLAGLVLSMRLAK